MFCKYQTKGFYIVTTALFRTGESLKRSFFQVNRLSYCPFDRCTGLTTPHTMACLKVESSTPSRHDVNDEDHGGIKEAMAVCGMRAAMSRSPPDFVTAISLVQNHGSRILRLRNAQEQTLLHLVAKHNKGDYAGLLLQRGADPSARDRYGWQPLRACCTSRGASLDVAKILLRHGADITAVGPDGWQVVHAAAFFGFAPFARFLIEHGVDPNARDRAEATPLHHASSLGRLEVVRVLMEFGADSSLVDKNGLRPVDVAVTCGYLQIVEHLGRL
jgi:ankyrin repeat protein